MINFTGSSHLNIDVIFTCTNVMLLAYYILYTYCQLRKFIAVLILYMYQSHGYVMYMFMYLTWYLHVCILKMQRKYQYSIDSFMFTCFYKVCIHYNFWRELFTKLHFIITMSFVNCNVAQQSLTCIRTNNQCIVHLQHSSLY